MPETAVDKDRDLAPRPGDVRAARDLPLEPVPGEARRAQALAHEQLGLGVAAFVALHGAVRAVVGGGRHPAAGEVRGEGLLDVYKRQMFM